QLRGLRARVPQHGHLPGCGRVAGARRRDAPGAVERDLLHRAREVHGMRRLPRPRGLRRGLPRPLLRAESGHPGDPPGAALARPRRPPPTEPTPRAPPPRSRRGGGPPAPPPAPPSEAPAPKPAPAPAPQPPAAAPAPVEEAAPGLAIPPPEEWEVPIRC